LGNLQEDVEVVGEDAVSEDADTAEGLVFTHEEAEVLLLGGTEDEVAIHDAGEAMVVGDGMGGRGLQTAETHEGMSRGRLGRRQGG
jgi:hypothetical protein